MGTLAELLPSLGAHLGVPGCTDVLGLPPVTRVGVLLIDGLGARLLAEAHASDPTLAPTLAGLAAARSGLVAGFPSTTPTSLGSLVTGLPPGQHGLVGFQSLVPDPERVMNLLHWDERVDPLAFQPFPTMFERAERAGVAVTTVGPRAFRGSGLTLAGLRGGGHRGADSLGELVAGMLARLAEPGPSLVYGYHADLDATGHRNGCGSPHWRAQLRVIDGVVQALLTGLPAGTALVVTGDHGMVDVPSEARIDLAAEPELMDGVALVSGEPRVTALQARPGAAQDVLATWRERLDPRDWLVLSVPEALAAGLYGPVRDGVAERIGDVLAIALGPVACVHSGLMPAPLLALVGLHGSVTPAEREVPLVVVTAEP